VPGEGVQHRVIEVDHVADHRVGDIGEGRHDQPRVHREGVDRMGEGAQLIDHRLRFEDAAVVGEGCEAGRIDLEPEVLAGDAHELGVDLEAAVQLQLEVGVVPADGQRTQQHGRGELRAAEAPARDADGEAHGVDAANGAQLGVAGGDPLGRHARGAQPHLVAEEVRQQGGAAGDELRQAAGVRLRDVDDGFGRVDEGGQRRRSAEIGRLSPQAGAPLLRRVRDADPGR